jgi:replicative DNA helicase
VNIDRIGIKESTVINCVFDYPEYILKITRNDFITSIGKTLYEIIDNLYAKEIDITKEHVIMHNEKDNNLNKEVIDKFRSQNYNINLFDDYIKELRKEKAKITIRTEILPYIAKTSASKEELQVEELNKIVTMLEKNINFIEQKDKVIYNMEDWFNSCEVDLKRRERGDCFYDTGCGYLNEILVRGFSSGDISLLFGPSGSGKSAYSLWLMNRMVTKMIPTVYFSTEMSKESQFDRFIAMRRHFDTSKLYPKNLNDFDSSIFDVLKKEREILRNTKYFSFIEKTGLSLAQVKHLVQQCQKEMKTKYMVVFIDLLTMLKDFEGNQKASSSEDAINKVLGIAKELGVHIFCVVQAKRPPNKATIRDIKDIYKFFQPTLETIKNSSEFEARCRNVFSIFRPYHFAKKHLAHDPLVTDGLLEDVAIIDNPKQNSGEIGLKRYYKFEGKYSNFIPYPTFDEIDLLN